MHISLDHAGDRIGNAWTNIGLYFAITLTLACRQQRLKSVIKIISHWFLIYP
jgi:hypothetical protein